MGARDHHRCVRCGADWHWAGMSIHHRLMRSHPFPGLNSPANLITLCGSGSTGCHAYVHEHPREAYEHGWLCHSWETRPELVPILTRRHGWVYLTEDGGWVACEGK